MVAVDIVYAYTEKKESERLDMQKRLLPILHKYNNVAFYACGHIHNFQHIQKKGDNIDYVVNSSSSLARPVKPMDGTVFCSPADGFSVFTADKKQLRMSMIGKRWKNHPHGFKGKKVKGAFLRKETNEDFNSDIDEKNFTECGASSRCDYLHPGTYAGWYSQG